ncbi:hypothetical protein BC827DRAFT_1218020 [Russula dissimulans]|nr:hypothetical protein BC827DRAFT_1218020 [Russula dissimulans]
MTSAPLPFSASRKITQPDDEAGAVTPSNYSDHFKPFGSSTANLCMGTQRLHWTSNVNSTQFSAGLSGYQRDPEKWLGKYSYPVHSTRPLCRWVWVCQWVVPTVGLLPIVVIVVGVVVPVGITASRPGGSSSTGSDSGSRGRRRSGSSSSGSDSGGSSSSNSGSGSSSSP